MTVLPAWLATTATLSDDALAELGNRGLIRRAQKIEVSLLDVAAKQVSVTCAGTDQLVVKLVPHGPQQAACPCPAAGVCVHVIAACLWARTVELPDEPAPAADPSPASRVVVRDTQTTVAAAIVRERGTECETAQYAIDVVEALLGLGLSHLSRQSHERLRGAAQRAKTGKLRLLSLLLEAAAGQVAQLADDRDEIDEKQVLSALAQVWAAGHAILRAPRDAQLPANLRGIADSETVDTGMLVPLGVRWWTSTAGARGYTAYWWDRDNRRVETLTNGRSKGSDPGFTKSWTAPLLLGRSLEVISNSTIRLEGAERDGTGQLRATARTRIAVVDAVEELDLTEISRQIGVSVDPATVGFGRPGTRVQVIAVRETARELLLDEINQELVWVVVDQERNRHELRVAAAGVEQNAVTLLLAFEQRVRAVVVIDGALPIAVFAGKPPRNLSLSLTRVAAPPAASTKRGQKKNEALLGKVRSASTDVYAARRAEYGHNEIERWAIRTRDVLTGLAATGVGDGRLLGRRLREQIDSLALQADEFGLAVAARLLREVGAVEEGERNPAAEVLQAVFVTERIANISRISALEPS